MKNSNFAKPPVVSFKLLCSLLLIQFIGILALLALRQVNQSSRLPDQILVVAILLLIPSLYLDDEGRFSRKNHFVGINFKILVFLTSFFMFLTIGLQTFTNVDRSRSLFMFEWIKCAPINTNLNTLQAKIRDNFGSEAEMAFSQRLHEQVSRGLVKINNNSPELTVAGNVVFISAVQLARLAKLEGWQRNFLWKQNEKCGY